MARGLVLVAVECAVADGYLCVHLSHSWSTPTLFNILKYLLHRPIVMLDARFLRGR